METKKTVRIQRNRQYRILISMTARRWAQFTSVRMGGKMSPCNQHRST